MTGKKHICLINGPNRNMLGKREPEVYGTRTLADILQGLKPLADSLAMELDCYQSNHEGEIVEKIHQVFESKSDGVIINPGAYTHTSVAIRDALLLLSCPVIEVHLSNIYKREPFRHHSYVADIAAGQIMGFGDFGYEMALRAMAEMTGRG